MISKLISYIDNINDIDSIHRLQRGENGHFELKWSENIKERILQFYYQLVRTKEYKQLDDIYTKLIFDVLSSNIPKTEMNEFIGILYKMIPYTRDIENGKGEYALSYMMIACWGKLQYVIQNDPMYSECIVQGIANKTINKKNIEYINSMQFKIFTNELVYHAIKNFVSTDNGNPIGSYKDIKLFIDYWGSLWRNVRNENKFMNDEFIKKIIRLANEQLKRDIDSINNHDKEQISLVSKWIPREKSTYGWMTKYFARDYFSKWFETAKTIQQQISAEKKAFTWYRKLLSRANKHIDTTQIKQCSGNWKDIDFNKGVTSITTSKQKYAFMNIKKNKSVKYPDNEDRIECATNYKTYIDNCNEGKTKMKGKCVSIYDFVKDAIATGYGNEQTIMDTINLQWKDNSNTNNSFNNIIAMVDTSGSMTSDNNTPLYNAIGLGIRIAERSTLGKRVLTFSEQSEWVNLDNCPDFISCVKKIYKAPWGMTTNFYDALGKILKAYVEMNLSPEEVEKYGLVILSDMQINQSVHWCSETTMNTMFEEIEQRFATIGMNSVYKTPYKVPFIVFWNLSKTNGFPSKSLTKNVAMISGYNPVLLNQFLDKGIETFKDYNPWDIMKSSLEHLRYETFESFAWFIVHNLFNHIP